jgi:predicted transglutaminase-like cysteine proteinase
MTRRLIKTLAVALAIALAGFADVAFADTTEGALFQPRESALLQMVNAAVNASHLAGVALPSDPDGVWDCDNYATAKYRSLRDDFHWAPSRLALGLAKLPDGQQHMVVLVRADGGWAILDNLTNAIVPLSERTSQHWRMQFAAFEPAAAGTAGWLMVPRAFALARG